MKKIVNLILLALIYIGVKQVTDVSVTYGSPIDSLIAHYAFDDNLNDGSGNGHNGTQLGSPSYIDGIDGKALNFGGDGSGDAVATGIQFAPTGSFSISLWFNVSEWDAKFGCVLIGDRGDNNAGGINNGFQIRQFASNSADTSGWLCFTSRGIATDRDFDPRNGETSTTIKYRSDMPYMKAIYPSSWNHLVAVYDKESGRKLIYINNYLVVDGYIEISDDYPGYIPADSYDKILIGARNDNDSTTNNPEKSFNGAIDDVRIYNSALTYDDVSGLYKAIAGNPVDSLVAYYAFEDNLADSSGNGHNGTQLGSPSYVDGFAGKALNFGGDGSGDAVATGIQFAPAGSFSVALWFNVNEWDAKFGSILIGDRGDNNAGGINNGFQIRQFAENSADESGWLCFTTRGIATDKDFDPRNGDTTTTIKYKSDMPYLKAIYPGNWNHMVFVYNKELGKKLVYINNSLVVDANVQISDDYPGYIPADSYDKILIGARNDNDSTTNNPEKSFNGTIDEVKIYNAALTGKDIDDLFKSYGESLPMAIAYWKLDETLGTTAYDEKGISDGTLNNIGDSLRVRGVLGKCLDFGSGPDSTYIEIPDNSTIDFDSLTSFSISALINVADVNVSGMDVLFKGATGKNTPDEKGHWYAISFKNNELRFVVDDDVDKSQLGFPNAYRKMHLDGDWNHIVTVRDLAQDSLFIFLNGEKVASMKDITENNIISTPLPLIIGNGGSHHSHLQGKLDEVIMYNEALTAVDIKYITDGYGITVKIPSNDATLSDLQLDSTTISGFASDIFTYNVDLPTGTTSVHVTATATHSRAIISGTGDIDVSSGSDTATITVTAEDGSTKEYNVVFTVGATNDANLTAITLDPSATLNPPFNKDVTEYTAELPAGTNSVNITVTKSNDKATVVGDGEFTITSGSDTAIIVVTAEDGSTTKTYKIMFSVVIGIDEIVCNGKVFYNSVENCLVFQNMENIIRVEIYDASGIKLTVNENVTTNKMSLDNLNLQKNAIYIVRIEAVNNVGVLKFIR